MNTIEEFFTNRLLFKDYGMYISDTVFKPEDYSLDFLKEKIKPLCYYLISSLGGGFGNWEYLTIILCETETRRAKDMIKFYNSNDYTPMSAESIGFNFVFLSSEFDRYFNWEKSQFCHLVPTNPFTIGVDIVKWWSEEEENNIEYLTEEVIEEVIRRREEVIRRREEEEEEEKRNKQINTDKSFKSDECVICLTNSPSVLFCNCGHLCLCEKCDEVKSLEKCPVCKTENTIKRTV